MEYTKTVYMGTVQYSAVHMEIGIDAPTASVKIQISHSQISLINTMKIKQ